MKNVPWHEEVISFSEQLADLLPDYSIASEHEHSNCILIAHKKVFVYLTIIWFYDNPHSDVINMANYSVSLIRIEV